MLGEWGLLGHSACLGQTFWLGFPQYGIFFLHLQASLTGPFHPYLHCQVNPLFDIYHTYCLLGQGLVVWESSQLILRSNEKRGVCLLHFTFKKEVTSHGGPTLGVQKPTGDVFHGSMAPCNAVRPALCCGHSVGFIPCRSAFSRWSSGQAVV